MSVNNVPKEYEDMKEEIKNSNNIKWVSTESKNPKFVKTKNEKNNGFKLCCLR